MEICAGPAVGREDPFAASSSAERLIPFVLNELHSLARMYLRKERPDQTLQPTALVNEAYIRLVGGQERDWHNRAYFIGFSASVMRRVLFDLPSRRSTLELGSV